MKREEKREEERGEEKGREKKRERKRGEKTLLCGEPTRLRVYVQDASVPATRPHVQHDGVFNVHTKAF